MQKLDQAGLTRRGFIQTAGAAGLACAAVGAAPREAQASPVEELIAQTMGPGTPAMERVNLNIPPGKQENAAMVKVPITVDHPMEPGNFIESLAIFVDENPRPLLGKFHFQPGLGLIDFEVRIKMAKKSMVRVIAKNNQGNLFGAQREVDVAAGGCA